MILSSILSAGRGAPTERRRKAAMLAAAVLLCASARSAAIGTGSARMGPMKIGRPLRVAGCGAFGCQGADARPGLPKRPDGRQRRQETRRMMASMPHANLAVRLDEPILSPSKIRHPTTWAALRGIGSIFLSDAVKVAVVAFVLALAMSLLSRTGTSVPALVSSPFRRAAAGAAFCYRWARGHMLRTADKIKDGAETVASARSGPAVPMAFDGDGGWGVCTLSSKQPVGRSKYVQYDFALPSEDNTLSLSLGQQVSLCCLDDDNNVVEGDFYPCSPRKERGKFSILVPAGSNMTKIEALLGFETADFVRALNSDLSLGDEVAIRPGRNALEYRGQYLPVKEMVFVAYGMGIVPVVDNVKAVLPNGSSSVKLASVVWFDKKVKNFDIADRQLETEYKKYPSKLAVTCIDSERFEDNPDVDEAIPNFVPGVMAVISGPRSFSTKAMKYLVDRGYPKDCICVLP